VGLNFSLLKLSIGHRVYLHGVSNRIVLELLLQNVISIWSIPILLEGAPLLEIIFCSLQDSLIVSDIERIIHSRTQVNQFQFILEL